MVSPWPREFLDCTHLPQHDSNICYFLTPHNLISPWSWDQGTLGDPHFIFFPSSVWQGCTDRTAAWSVGLVWLADIQIQSKLNPDLVHNAFGVENVTDFKEHLRTSGSHSTTCGCKVAGWSPSCFESLPPLYQLYTSCSLSFYFVILAVKIILSHINFVIFIKFSAASLQNKLIPNFWWDRHKACLNNVSTLFVFDS